MISLAKTTGLVVAVSLLGLSTGPNASLSAAAGDCILGCFDFEACGETMEHYAPTQGDFALYVGGPHNPCVEGLCNCPSQGGSIPPKHPYCPSALCGEEEELLQLSEGSTLSEDVADAVEKFGDKLQIVPERSALQLIGCKDRIVAHIPLSASVLEEFARQLHTKRH